MGWDHKWGPILVGTDGSAGAARAVDAAGGLASELNTDLWIVTVMGATDESILSRAAKAERAVIGDTAKAIANGILDRAVEHAERGRTIRIHTIFRSGDHADEIIAAACELGVAAIFVGRRGAGGRLARALLGSVSQKLAGISPIMLVIVP